MNEKTKDFYYTRISRRDIDLCNYLDRLAALYDILRSRGFPLTEMIEDNYLQKVPTESGDFILVKSTLHGPEGILEVALYRQGLSPAESAEHMRQHHRYWEALDKLGLSHNDLSFDEWQNSSLKEENERLRKLNYQAIERAVNPPIMFATTQQQLEQNYKVAQKNVELGRKEAMKYQWFKLFVAVVAGIMLGHFMGV